MNHSAVSHQETLDLVPCDCASLDQALEVAVSRWPDRIALCDSTGQMSYRVLWEQANQLAAALRQLPSPGLVAIVGGVHQQHVVAICAVLLAGHAYVSFDAGCPAPFVEAQLDLLKIQVIIRAEADGSTLHDRQGARLPEPSKNDTSNFRREASSPACATMTSGSTGEPKLLVFQDRHLIHEAQRQQLDIGLTQSDRMDQLFSFQFSASLACVFPALLSGASLHLLDLTREGWAALPAWWERERITISNLSSSTFRKIVATTQPFILPDLRLLCIGAEVMHSAEVAQFLALFPASCELQHAYASTETRTAAHWLLRRDGWPDPSRVPIGRAVTGKSISLQREDGQEAATGEIAEIIIESEWIPSDSWVPARLDWENYLATQSGTGRRMATGDLGYRDALGMLYWTGRKDFQLNIRGHKVSPEWVEQLLRAALPGALPLAVTWHSMHGYVGLLGSEQAEQALGEIKDALQSMPSYLRPLRWMRVDSLPTNRNGKLDRLALANISCRQMMVQTKAFAVSPLAGSELLMRVRTIFTEVLDVSEIDPEADFFDDLGGDSLQAADAWGRILGEFQLHSSFEQMYRLRTAFAIAQWIKAHGARDDGLQLLAHGNPALGPVVFLSPIGNSFNCYEHLLASWPLDRQAIGLVTPLHEGKGEPLTLTRVVADATDRLESRFPLGSMILFGFSFAGVLATSICLELLRRGREVDLILIDTATYRPTSMVWKLIGYPLRRGLARCKRLIQSGPTPAKSFSWQRGQSRILQDFTPAIHNPQGKLLFIEASQKTLPGFHYRRDLDWDSWCHTQIHRQVVHTRHHLLLTKPWVEEVAAFLRRHIPHHSRMEDARCQMPEKIMT